MVFPCSPRADSEQMDEMTKLMSSFSRFTDNKKSRLPRDCIQNQLFFLIYK
jgi:hypothetical protein